MGRHQTPAAAAATAAAVIAPAILAAASLAAATPADTVLETECAVAIIGGGIGGVYTAWRLAVDTRTVRPADVCIFEGSDRFGGRIFSVDNVPGYEGLVTDVGAYRFHRTDHPIMRALTEDALGIETACYTDPTMALPMDVAECPEPTRKFFTTRTVSFMGDLDAGKEPDFSAWTPRLPYFLSEAERWGPRQPRRARRRLEDVFTGNGSLIPELAGFWDALADADTPFEATMALADEALAAVRRGSYKGVPYSDVSVVQLARDAGMSSEELEMEAAFQPGGAAIFNTNVLQQLTIEIRQMATERLGLAAKGPAPAMVVPVTGKGADRKRAGMASIIHKMLDAAESAGVRVYTRQRAVAVSRWDRGTLRVNFAAGGRTTARRVFLNMGASDLRALGGASEPAVSASAAAARRLDAALPIGASKLYCFWPAAWWLAALRLSAGSGLAADGPAVSGLRYHDGPVACGNPADVATCRGGLLVSYAIGDATRTASGLWGATYADVPYTPTSGTDALTVFERRRLTPRQRLAWTAIVDGLRDAHAPVLAARNATGWVIPEPDVCVMAAWFDITLHVHRATTTLGDAAAGELFAQPAPGLPVHLVNEAWGDTYGWAEGSLQSAERALHAHLRLPPPAWLNGLVHASVIKNFNKGS